MHKKKKISKQHVLLFILSFMLLLSGCINSTNEEEVENVDDREELTESILKLKPSLKEDLEELSTDELQQLNKELKTNREQKIDDRLKGIDKNKQIDEGDIKHHHDPNPPQPPIYEKPKPPTEEN